MIEKSIYLLVVALGTVALVVMSLLCYSHWPEKESSLPAWFQAIGSIAAVLGAGAGIWAQLRHTERKAARDALDDQHRVLVALLAEIEVYIVAVDDIADKVSQNLGVLLSGMLQMIFPSASFRFPVYRANADRVWAIPDDALRRKLIGVYAELDMLFALLDRNSAVAQNIREDESPTGDVAKQLEGLYPIIEQQLGKLTPEMKRLQVDLKAHTEALPNRMLA